MRHSTSSPNAGTSGLAGRLIAPFAIAMLIVLAGVVTLIWVAARGQDDIAARSSEMVMQSVIENQRTVLGQLVYDTTWWDEAIEHLIVGPDEDWASINIGDYATETFGITSTFVISAEGETVFAFLNGVPSLDTADAYFGEQLTTLIETARRAPMAQPEPAVAFLRRDDDVHLVGVSALTPETPTPAELRWRVRPVLVQARHVSGGSLAELADQFGFAGLSLEGDWISQEDGRSAYALNGPDGDPAAWLTWQPARPGAQLFWTILPWLCAGAIVLLAVSAQFVSRAGRVARDVAEDKVELARMDKQLAQASKLAVLGEMSAGLVHELNQPLNIIRMTTDTTRQMLRRSPDGLDDTLVGEQFDVIGGQVQRMDRTIQSMRLFSRDDYGHKVAFDPVATTSQAVSWMRKEMSEREIELQFRSPPECGRVFGEPSRFEQVIVNLLLNARDAVDGRFGGEADQRGVIRVTVDENVSKSRVTISVRDNGGGVPPNEIDRLFEPFFTTKAPGEGTGLGLSISYGIVSGMDGTLVVENDEEGAVFTVALPRVAPPPAETRGEGRVGR